jgi:hypothetical protein
MSNEEETRTEGQDSTGRKERRQGYADCQKTVEGGVRPTATDAGGTTVRVDDRP